MMKNTEKVCIISQIDSVTIQKIGEILISLEKRIGELEDGHARIFMAIRDAQNASNLHSRGIEKLQGRLHHEIRSVLDAVDDLNDMLGPVHERVMPGIGPFKTELARVIARYRRPRPGDGRQ